MDGGGSMHSNDERGVEKLMDGYLKSIGLHRKKIAKDGSCLFRAVAEQVLHCQSLHTQVRAKCVEFLKQNRDTYEAFIEGDFEDYMCKLQDLQHWVGEVEINALAAIYKRDFLIFQEPGKPAVNITGNNFKDTVQLCFLNGNHYDSVYPISHIKNTALCQSILYELLYEGVFKVDRSSLGSCQRVSRPADLLSDDCMAVCASSDESDLETDEAMWVDNGTGSTPAKHSNQSYRGRGRARLLPERVRRSLNPTLLRNVQYDVWHKTKRAQQKMDYCIAAGMQFTVGDRCQVRLEGSSRPCNAIIKEVPPDNHSVTVYLEHQGRKQVVPLWSLRPPGDDSGWSKVVNRDKRLSNGHGEEWELRGKGRGRGKSVASSCSSGSPAAAPGSGGRVLKQQSWPPQGTVEEQGGAKTSRKSGDTPEVAFGLTEEQRLAKEEEDRNVALVEIQLRDEHSFPALGSQPGTQAEGGKRKGEKKRSQRNKTKSPVDDIRTPSPSARDKPKSSTPPLKATTTPAALDTTAHTNPTLPAAKLPADSTPTWLSSIKASPSSSAGPAASLPLTCAAPAAKTNAPSYTSPAVAPTSPPAAAPSTKSSLTGEAPPPSVPSSAFSHVFPVLPSASSPSASSSTSSPKLPPAFLPSPKPTTSPPPSSSVPSPTFITPIAGPPTAAPGFPAARSSPPVSFLHSPTPPSSPSLIHPSAEVQEAPPAPASTTNSSPKTGASQISQSQTCQCEVHPQVSSPQTQTSLLSTEKQAEFSASQIQTQGQASLPQIPGMVPQMLNEPQDQPQCSTEALPLPQTDLQTHIQSFQPPPGASYAQSSQASLPHPHVQPPHPSQVPHPSLSLSASTLVPQTEPEAPSPAPQQPQPAPESPAPPASEKTPPPQPSHSAPPQPQSIPAAVPLQQIAQLYLDPLYPGFPLGEKGDMAPIPNYSSNKSGDDLPKDVNVLRFFFNLGLKAFSNNLCPPYLYLIPLHQAHAMQPKPPSRSPSPHYVPSNPPTNPQDSYPPLQYPYTSAPVPSQYDRQAPLDETPRPTEPPFSQARYSFNHPSAPRMPWQQMPPSQNPNYSVGYLSPPPAYPGPPHSSQVYHPGQGAGVPMYPTGMAPYSASSLPYQTASTPQELQVSQGAMQQQLQPTNGDTMPGHGNIRVPGPLENSSAASVANTNNNRPVVVQPSYGFKKETGETLTRAVLLVDPPLNDTPIVALVPDIPIKDSPVITMKTSSSSSSSPGSPSTFRPRKPVHHPMYEQTQRGGHLKPITVADNQSVGCSTEDDWEEMEGYKVPVQRGQRRNYRGRGGRGWRGRGGYDPSREVYRGRNERDMGMGFNYVQANSTQMGWSHERRY